MFIVAVPVYFVLHGVIAVVAAAIVVERVRTLFYCAPLEARPYLRTLEAALEQGNHGRVEQLARLGRPAWLAELVWTALRAPDQGMPVEAALEERFTELRFEAEQRVRTLRVLGSLGSAVGLLGAVLELIGYLQGDLGLAGLMAGLAERIAFRRAVTSLVAGVAIAMVCLSAFGVVRPQARRLITDMGRTVRLLEEQLGSGAPPARSV
jgi:biopolymer transport protein ExbB/TolQ